MSKDIPLINIKEECEYIIANFSKNNYQEILENTILKRALIGSLHLIVRRLPRNENMRKIEYYSSVDDLKGKLIRSIQDSEYKFNEKKLFHFLEFKILKILQSIIEIL